MPGDTREVAAAKRKIKAFLIAPGAPRQVDIATALGFTQGYVSKISRGKFSTLNAGVRSILEYSENAKLGRGRSRRHPPGDLEAKLLAISQANPKTGTALRQLIQSLSEKA